MSVQLLSLRATVVIVGALLIAVITVALTCASGAKLPKAILAGGAAFGASVVWLNGLVASGGLVP